MVLELILILRQSFEAVIPGNTRDMLEECMKISEGVVEPLGVAFGAPEGGWAAGRGELCADHEASWLCYRLKELPCVLLEADGGDTGGEQT